MRCACIDIGSNTTRLLVAEPGAGPLETVAQQRAFTRIGRGLRAGGGIAPEKIAQVAEVVAAQARLARELGADPIRAVATAAIRGAANSDDLVAAVLEASGIRVEVLDEHAEARLAFAGATLTLGRAPGGEVGVVDVGGGSTELAVGTFAGGVAWSASLGIGSGLLADAHLRSDPPAPAELDAVREHVANAFATLDDPPPVGLAIAVGGSATSLRRFVGGTLGRRALERGVETLASAPATEIARRFDLDAERVRLLPAGILVLAAAAERFGVALEIACGGLREGVVLEMLGGVRDANTMGGEPL